MLRKIHTVWSVSEELSEGLRSGELVLPADMDKASLQSSLIEFATSIEKNEDRLQAIFKWTLLTLVPTVIAMVVFAGFLFVRSALLVSGIAITIPLIALIKILFVIDDLKHWLRRENAKFSTFRERPFNEANPEPKHSVRIVK